MPATIQLTGQRASQAFNRALVGLATLSATHLIDQHTDLLSVKMLQLAANHLTWHAAGSRSFAPLAAAISRALQQQTPACTLHSAQFSTSTASGSAAAPANAMQLVKELRQQSGAPISDVKSCLAASNWDMSAAMEALRLKGLAAAVKKASRHASEGLVGVAQASPRCVSVVEINSETDFVGRSEPFQQLVKAAAAAAAALLPQQPAAVQVQQLDFDQLSAARLDASGSTVSEGCANLAGKVRENIALRRGWLMAGGPNSIVSSYVHMPVAPGAGRIAAVVGLEAPGVQQLSQETEQQMSELAGQLSMHAAGMNTQHVSASSISQDVLASVRQDFASQTEALMPGKPAQVLNKIVDGKVAKWLKESCLLDQKFVLDDSVTVQQLLKAKGQQMGLPGPLQVSGLLRVQVGEGMEKEDDQADFAAEVAAMAAGGK